MRWKLLKFEDEDGTFYKLFYVFLKNRKVYMSREIKSFLAKDEEYRFIDVDGEEYICKITDEGATWTAAAIIALGIEDTPNWKITPITVQEMEL